MFIRIIKTYSTTTGTDSLPPSHRNKMKYTPDGTPLHSHSNSPYALSRIVTRMRSLPSTLRPIESYTPSIASPTSKLPSQAMRALTGTPAGCGYGSDAQNFVV
ncbi:MAG: hypothetical protein ACK42G_01570 [Candidatus Kapaibacteriota bacterium]